MAVLLALIAAVAYGASDFVSGLQSKRAGPFAVAVLATVSAFVIVAVGTVLGPGHLTTRALVAGLVAGVGNAVGTVALYRGLALGAMNVVAPLSGVLCALLPVVVGVLTGDRPSLPAVIGIVLALIAITTVSLSPQAAPVGDRPGTPHKRGVVEGIGAGIGFGMIFTGLGRAGPGAGLWPTSTSILTGLIVLLVAAAVGRQSLRMPRPSALPVMGAGVLSGGAVILYQLALGRGLLSLVAVITSLYPALTVILAALVLRERSTRLQLGGMAVAVVAVVLITVS